MMLGVDHQCRWKIEIGVSSALLAFIDAVDVAKWNGHCDLMVDLSVSHRDMKDGRVYCLVRSYFTSETDVIRRDVQPS